jgi:hypothetical protein
MLTAKLMKSMDDHHLLASARAEQDPLTSSAAEIELLARFERLLDEASEHKPVAEAVEEFDFEAKDIEALGDALIQNTSNTVALLEAIAQAGIDDPESLKADLDLVKKFRALTEDAGDVFTRLSQLTTEQE